MIYDLLIEEDQARSRRVETVRGWWFAKENASNCCKSGRTT